MASAVEQLIYSAHPLNYVSLCALRDATTENEMILQKDIYKNHTCFFNFDTHVLVCSIYFLIHILLERMREYPERTK